MGLARARDAQTRQDYSSLNVFASSSFYICILSHLQGSRCSHTRISPRKIPVRVCLMMNAIIVFLQLSPFDIHHDTFFCHLLNPFYITNTKISVATSSSPLAYLVIVWCGKEMETRTSTSSTTS